MGLSRREFGRVAIAAGAAALLTPVRSVVAMESARYVHVEIGPGPRSRGELAALAERIAAEAGLGAPVGVSALGVPADAAEFPREFVLSLDYADGARMVLRASAAHEGRVEVVIRGWE